jgi:hypothetical protein
MLVQIEQSNDDVSAATETIQYLCESGKSGRFIHFVENKAKQWWKVCALEEALVEQRITEDWKIVVGKMETDDEIEGWLICDDWYVIPLGPKGQESGSDVLVLDSWDFLALHPITFASCDVCDESGILLNKQMKENFYLDEDRSLGE